MEMEIGAFNAFFSLQFSRLVQWLEELPAAPRLMPLAKDFYQKVKRYFDHNDLRCCSVFSSLQVQ